MDTKANSPTEPRNRTFLKALGLLLILLVIVPAIGFIILWSALAITYAGVSDQNIRWALGSSFAIVFFVSFFSFPKRMLTTMFLLTASGAVFWWWTTLKPSHDRQWSQLSAVLPIVRIEGNTATVQSIRNFKYLAVDDYIPEYYDKTFDLSKLETLDLIISYWGGGKHTAHSMLSFGFKDGGYLCVSVEARAEDGEEYSGIAGLFRKYELIYVLGDEMDLIGSRTGVRAEQVYLYPTNTPPADVRKLFEKIAARVNQIAKTPEFYNTITDNCTTCLAYSGRSIVPPGSFDYRLLLNGYADEMAYENGWIATKDSFAETRDRHHVNRYVEGKGDTGNFSRLIRPHLRGLPSKVVTPKSGPEIAQ
ncbi:MAG: DUF4105 domain-containing protein [Phycisphaerae bacterium]|jgi:hypothetical protein|nr:DUF4105 domain-containing protein [Phycisphaerae bacterium]